ncbi:hypothetical protein ACQPYK_05785 [Streptosporangium sp. CA-135522]|uniref:hypothetical protein n=1 Tax=Streptosporangium sp. CA-135522 TaxID=3240072 RepID=UPI003D8C86BF
MLKSKTRRRVAVKTAAIAAACGGIFFGAVPAIASLAAPKTVSYTCTSSSGTSASAMYKLQMDITGPLAPTPNSAVVATWAIRQPAAPPSLVAPSAISATERLVVDGDALITSSPSIVPSQLQTVGATAVAAAVASGAPLQLPNVLITITPTATGVVAIQPEAFSLYLQPTTATGSTTGNLLYDCVVATTASAEASAAALLITVKPSGASTGTGSPTPSPTPTTTGSGSPTTTTLPDPVVTVTRTKTSKPTHPPKDRQIDETPGGGASTGGGGEAGPDARMIVLGGALMVAFAAIGGLVLRRRTATRG